MENEKRAPISKDVGTRAQSRLNVVHTDVLGPLPETSFDGYNYAIGVHRQLQSLLSCAPNEKEGRSPRQAGAVHG